MKMVRKILLGTLAIATVLAFTSCGVKEDEEKAIDGKRIDFENTTEKNYRAFVTTKTKHYSANAVITLDNPTEVKGSKANYVLGFVFGVEEKEHNPKVEVFKKNEKGEDTTEKETVTFYNFGIAGLRYNKSTSKVEWYVSWCKDVPNTILGYNNEGEFKNISVTDINGVVSTYGEETQIVPKTGTFKEVAGLNLTDDNKLSVIIKTVAKDDGSYDVSICNADEDVKDSVTIPATTTGLTTKTQKLIGRYVTVYAGESVKGTIEYTDVNGNVIPLDDEE